MCKKFIHLFLLAAVLGLAFAETSNAADPSLVGWWKLDDGSGTVAKDSSANQNHGTLNGALEWVEGVIDGALQFDGSTGYVDIPANLNQAVINKGDFSMMAWIKSADLTGTNYAFQQRDQNGTGRSWLYAIDGNITTYVGVGDLRSGFIIALNEWYHAGFTVVEGGAADTIQIYVNGEPAGASAQKSMETCEGGYLIGSHKNMAAASRWPGVIDDVRLYNRALTAEDIQKAMRGMPELAADPVPADKLTDVLHDATLAWTPGDLAASHDVYLGTSFDDVNDATTTDPKGVLVSQGQTDVAYVPDSPLEYGQTYYWRIDEVNGAPDYTAFKGQVWSFTVEPYAYPIADLTVTASSEQATSPAIRTIDRSGLDEFDQHDTNLQNMWSTSGGLPAWIQYTFDKEYKLHELWVWNANSELEAAMGFGAKDVTIEYSADGQTWTPLATVPEFAQGTGFATYTSNTTVDLAGVMARHVRLTINDNWGTTTMVSLSEVRFFSVPVQAFEPQPQVSATGVSVETDLTWRPGREATSHVVYIGTDSNAVADGAVSGQTTTERLYTPADLTLETEYFWKVDEVGDTGTYAGDVWNFTTEEFAVVDDFESYTDDMDAEEAVFQTWIDGYEDEANGSIVGLQDAVKGTFCETTIIHGGGQSMPFFYDISGGATYAEAKRTFDPAQDWTTRGIKSLTLYFNGVTGNTGQLYVKINNTKVAYDGLAVDIAEAMWLPWNIDLPKVGNVGSVKSLTIGVEGSGAKGTLYFDDIRLYPRTPEYVVPTQPDTANLVAQYTFDGNLKDSAGSHHGTALGNAAVGTDPTRGQVLSLDGTGDAVDVAYSADLNPAAFTASFWAYPDAAGTGHRSPLTSRDDSPQRGYIFYIEPGNAWQFWTGSGTGWNATTGPTAKLGEWTHVTATFGNEQRKLYINGRLAGEGAPLSPNTQRPLRIGGGATEGAGNYFFPGKMDEVRLYNRVLTAEEVAGLAGQTTSLPVPF